MYRSLAKVRPPFMHCTSRNERGMGIYMRIMQFYSKIGPPRKLHKLYEEGNAFDKHAVAVWKDRQVVGHLPQEIATTCWYFLCRRNSRIVWKIAGHRHLLEIRGKGLVVPCMYTFEGKQNHI